MAVTEIVTIHIGGSEFSDWKSVSVKADAKSPEMSFEVVAADRIRAEITAAAWGFEPDTPVTITATGELVLTGYIDELSIEIDPENHEMRISGRSKGMDCVDCSVDHKSYEWKNKDLKEIAQEVDTWGIGFHSDEQLDKFEKVRANVGETGFNFLDRLARNQGVFLAGQPDGTVKITKHGKEWHAGGIIEGINLHRGAAQFGSRQRMGKTKVKGQRPVGTGKKNLHIQEEEIDQGARKERVRILMPKTALDRNLAKKRAKTHADAQFGEHVRFQATMVGWRDEGGQLWMPGKMVWCESISLRLAHALAIDSVTRRQDYQSTNTDLVLVHPSALGANGNNKGPGTFNKKSGNFKWNAR